MKRLLLSLVFLGSVPCFAEVLAINQFGGLNSDDSTVVLQNGQTPDSQNVVDDLGQGLQGRKGFIQFSTQPAVDIWQFPLSSGVRYFIKRSSNTLLADTGDGTFQTLVSTIPTDRKTVASVLGDKFFFVNTTDGLKYWNGTSVSVASTSLTFSMLVTHKGRLWGSGKSGEERTIRASKLYDGTTWTAPVNPSDDDATSIQVSGALDENIQAIYASFQDKLMYFKKNSFGAVFGSRRTNFVLRSFSETVGLAAPETIQDCDGFLRWLGNNRKVWEFDGNSYYKISEQVNALFSALIQGDTATRSTILTSKADWDGGTFGNAVVPAANLSSSITEGSIVLSTMAVVTLSDTSASDFGAGTLVTLDSSTTPGSLTLPYGSESVIQEQYGADEELTSVCGTSCRNLAQSFTTASAYFITGVTLRLKKNASFSDTTVSIYSDSSNSPGSIMASAPILNSSVSSSFADVSVAIATVAVKSGTRYWVVIADPSGCSSGTGLIWAITVISSGESYRTGACSLDPFRNMKYKILGKTYASSGSILSRTFDIGFSTNSWLFNLGTISSTLSTPATSTITFQTQTSADGVTFDALVPVANNTVSTSTTRQYIRYKASFSTSFSTITPMMSDVTILNGPFLKSSGTYQSSLVNVGTNISAWGPVTIGNSVSSGGTETFQIGSTNTASVSAISNWTTITNNSVPTIAINPYVAFRSTFTATRATDTVRLDDFTFAWTDGSTLRSASGYIDQRYWLSCATTSATNNIIYVYDRKKQWQRYSGINADTLGQFNSSLYFGNTTGIYQTEQGYSDAGSNIISYYKTKDYAPTHPDIPSIFNYNYITTDKSDATLSSSYFVNGSTLSIAMGDYQMNQSDGLIQNFKIGFPSSDATQGNFINFKWQITGTSFWRMILSNLYYNRGFEPK